MHASIQICLYCSALIQRSSTEGGMPFTEKRVREQQAKLGVSCQQEIMKRQGVPACMHAVVV